MFFNLPFLLLRSYLLTVQDRWERHITQWVVKREIENRKNVPEFNEGFVQCPKKRSLVCSY